MSYPSHGKTQKSHKCMLLSEEAVGKGTHCTIQVYVILEKAKTALVWPPWYLELIKNIYFLCSL